MTFADRLIIIMRREKLTQRDVARRCSISEGSLSRIVRDQYMPNLETLTALCRGLNVSADELLGLKER